MDSMTAAAREVYAGLVRRKFLIILALAAGIAVSFVANCL
jgi:hypothetical protein